MKAANVGDQRDVGGDRRAGDGCGKGDGRCCGGLVVRCAGHGYPLIVVAGAGDPAGAGCVVGPLRPDATLAGSRLAGVCARGQRQRGELGGNRQVITAQAVELRIGARVLLEESSFRIAAGDRIGLVGRNGAGKTTLTKTLAGETQPTGGQIVRSGDVGYLPQDPRTGDLEQLAMDRVLSARGLDEVVRAMRATETAMASEDDAVREKAMDRYSRLDSRFNAAGGYAAESEAHRIASNLGLDERVLGQTIGTLSGGQRRRVELARILFSGVETLLLDEPTNHLDADSIMWLRDYLKTYSRRAHRHLARRRPAARRREQGLPPGRQPLAARPVRPRLGRVPAAARDGREAPPPRAGQRREEGLRPAWRRPTRCAPRPPRPSPRRTWRAAPSACCPGSRTSGRPTRSRACGSPSPPRAARPR